MAKSAKDVEKALLKKGFREENGRDHKFFYFYYNEKKTSVRTKISRGASHKEIQDGVLKQMQFQMNLTKDQFDLFVKCPLSIEEYINILLNLNKLK